MFDSAVFALWPRGIYLAKKLCSEGQKTAYIEILPRFKNPFGLFLDTNSKEEKLFLESLGFLYRQAGGFCIISPEGVWPMQNMKDMLHRHTPLQNIKIKMNQNPGKQDKIFKNNWLSYLSLNLAGKVFECNDSELSNKSLDLFSDYFLFESSLKKERQFREDHPQISFFKTSLEKLSFENGQPVFSEEGQILISKKYFWLGDPHIPVSKIKPDWQWQALFFEVDFADYKDIVPSHFICLKNIFLPWCYDNLLSVFHYENQLEVWMRTAYKKPAPAQEAQKLMETYFPGARFSLNPKMSFKAFAVYDEKSLAVKTSNIKNGCYIEDLNDFFQGDLISEIQAEQELFEKL